ncbi:MAG: hypothetical protein KDC98_10710 [Planctomycetes bacterium]|nr:hypothetical protein [Planctomycetota bacterium]
MLPERLQRPSRHGANHCLTGATLALIAITCGGATAQTILPVHYGDPVVAGAISAANEVDSFIFNGAQGDLVFIVFRSDYDHHQLQIRQGTTSVGTTIVARGTLTAVLPNTGPYLIDIEGRNNTWTGGYHFQINRLNDPVGADRMALDWHLRGTITSPSQFELYTIRVAATGDVRFEIASAYDHHQVQLIDSSGTPILGAAGTTTSATITVQTTDVYTVVVRGRDPDWTGSYSASLQCRSWPFRKCDDQAFSGNYGPGVAGTLGVPSLTSNSPGLGTTLSVDIGNSSGQTTTALLLVGRSSDVSSIPSLGGTVLVANPTIIPFMNVPVGGALLNISLPTDPWLSGLGFAAQSLVIDGGAPAGVAFSRGLAVIPG